MKYLIVEEAGKESAVIFGDELAETKLIDLTETGPKVLRAGHLVIALKSSTATSGQVLTGMNFICIPETLGNKATDEALIKTMIGENI